jgi:hypothetical protein
MMEGGGEDLSSSSSSEGVLLREGDAPTSAPDVNTVAGVAFPAQLWVSNLNTATTDEALVTLFGADNVIHVERAPGRV